MAKKKLMIFTHADYWNMNCGSHVRILHLLRALTSHFDVSVIYIGAQPLPSDHAIIPEVSVNYLEVFSGWEKWPKQRDVYFPAGMRHLRSYAKTQLAAYWVDKIKPDIVVIEYIMFAYLLETIPKQVTTVIDLHDLQSVRQQAFERNLLPHWCEITQAEEAKLIDQFDFALAIQGVETQTLRPLLKSAKALELGVFQDEPKQTLKVGKWGKDLAFVGADNAPNIDAVEHFLRAIWPALKPDNFRLHLFGSVARRFAKRDPNIICRGYVSDLTKCLNEMSIGINPVRCGGGVKVKTLEFLAHSLPVVTSREGCSGLENGAGSAYLLAQNDSEFAAHILRLGRSPIERHDLGRSARRYFEYYNDVQRDNLRAFVSQLSRFATKKPQIPLQNYASGTLNHNLRT